MSRVVLAQGLCPVEQENMLIKAKSGRIPIHNLLMHMVSMKFVSKEREFQKP